MLDGCHLLAGRLNGRCLSCLRFPSSSKIDAYFRMKISHCLSLSFGLKFHQLLLSVKSSFALPVITYLHLLRKKRIMDAAEFISV
mmetsp:Transcript_22751/g.45536  ORF Transcript_22751/g.45536 Transcript_22751/m.45536 type:complete len:85 (+) Transcript_22751:841-1095(+)